MFGDANLAASSGWNIGASAWSGSPLVAPGNWSRVNTEIHLETAITCSPMATLSR
jgi:hypothetical protein